MHTRERDQKKKKKKNEREEKCPIQTQKKLEFFFSPLLVFESVAAPVAATSKKGGRDREEKEGEGAASRSPPCRPSALLCFCKKR